MKQSKRISVVVLLLVCFLCFAHPNAARAATVVTNIAAFTAALAPGYYVDNFSELTGGEAQLPSTLYGLGGNGFTYNAVDRGSAYLYALPDDGSTPSELTTFINGFTLGFDFTSGNVTAVGGYFFSTNVDGEPDGGSLTLTLSDGTPVTINNTSLSSFVGFLSPGVFITSLDITPAFDSYATVADLYVGDVGSGGGTGVPEPATFGLLAAGLIVGGLLRKRLSRV